MKMKERETQKMENCYDGLENVFECISKGMDRLDMLIDELSVLVGKGMSNMYYIGELCDECTNCLDCLKRRGGKDEDKRVDKLDMFTNEFDIVVSKGMDNLNCIGDVGDECAVHLNYLKMYIAEIYRIVGNEKLKRGDDRNDFEK